MEQLASLDAAIADAESRADAAFFEDLLHPHFVMVRPSGLTASKAEFIAGLATGSHREASKVEITAVPERRAIVRCIVTKDGARYDNLRVYWRGDEGWQLLAWVNEPV